MRRDTRLRLLRWQVYCAAENCTRVAQFGYLACWEHKHLHWEEIPLTATTLETDHALEDLWQHRYCYVRDSQESDTGMLIRMLGTCASTLTAYRRRIAERQAS